MNSRFTAVSKLALDVVIRCLLWIPSFFLTILLGAGALSAVASENYFIFLTPSEAPGLMRSRSPGSSGRKAKEKPAPNVRGGDSTQLLGLFG